MFPGAADPRGTGSLKARHTLLGRPFERGAGRWLRESFAVRTALREFAVAQETGPRPLAQLISTQSVLAGSATRWVRRIRSGLSLDISLLVRSAAEPDVVGAAQGRVGRIAAAEAIAALLLSRAALFSAPGVGRFVVAGGESSGAAGSVRGRSRRTAHCARVPLVCLAEKPLGLARKSGYSGGPGFLADPARKPPRETVKARSVAV